MQEFLQDPVLLILLGACVVLMVAVIIGIVVTIKKNKNRVPMYKIKIVYNEILEQYLMITDKFNFGTTSKEDEQSKLLKEAYPIGSKIKFETDENKSMELTVSSHQKIFVTSLLVNIPYKIYFKEYENIEFPHQIIIQKNEKYVALLFTERGFELKTVNDMVEEYMWNEIKIEHLNEFVAIYWKHKSKVSNEIFRFVDIDTKMYRNVVHRNAISLKSDDYEFVCEIMEKYSEWAWN